MSDSGPKGLRELERQWKKSGLHDDAVLYLRALLKAGFSRERLRQVALLGWGPAVEVAEIAGESFLISPWVFFGRFREFGTGVDALCVSAALYAMLTAPHCGDCDVHRRQFTHRLEHLLNLARGVLKGDKSRDDFGEYLQIIETSAYCQEAEEGKCPDCMILGQFSNMYQNADFCVTFGDTMGRRFSSSDISSTWSNRLQNCDLTLVAEVWKHVMDRVLNEVLPYLLVID